MHDRRRLFHLGLVCAVAPLIGRARAAPPVATVEIRDYKFEPATLAVKTGTTVRWSNQEKRTSHSVLFTGPGGFESERMFPGDTWERTFDKAGSYPFTCGPHPEMKGRVEVTD